MSEQYLYGPTVTVNVQDTSVGLPAATLKPTTGDLNGMELTYALIQAIGALYVETGGGAATTAGFPMNAGDIIPIEGHAGCRNVRFIRNTTNTTIVVIPMYR